MRVLYITLFAVIFDQVSKFFVRGLKIDSLGINLSGMPYGSSKQVFGDFVRITFIENAGMAFGISIGPRVLLPLLTFAASVFIVYYLYKHRKDTLVLRMALAFILAGALGNLIDRTFYGLIYGYAPLFYGRVVDFFQVEFWDFTVFGKTYTTWPVLNVADFSVTIGFLLIVVFNNRIFKLPQSQTTLNSPEDENTGHCDLKNESVQTADGINITGSTIN